MAQNPVLYKFPPELLSLLELDKEKGITPLALDEKTLRIYFDHNIDDETVKRFRKILNDTYRIEKINPRTVDFEKRREWRWDWNV